MPETITAACPKEILDLVERFSRNIEEYKSHNYKEAQARQEFINPFFEALEWDVANKDGKTDTYKDVIHEPSVKVGAAIKAPDYSFRIGGISKFFVEAKKPSVNIIEDSDSAYQLRRYAWNAKLPLSILTNFEWFAVYDCRIRPSPKDKPTVAYVKHINYKEYPTRWNEITELFSKRAIEHGLFDRFISKGKRGASEVDDEFLAEIEEWRERLAHNLALRNRRLTVRDLNFAVQRTLDRIIFLRICEDRGIEQENQLLNITDGANIYRKLCSLFQRADERYNSGIFHFNPKEKLNEPADELTLTLKIDDEVLKDIIDNLYYPKSPYVFSVLPIAILGNVYEQFLGKVIRLTKSHHAKVEEKPEVKKAGDVYYTPTYIVDYIVQNTVGKLCEGKTPKEIAKLRILDPACGSGSFLIGAYTYLLTYHHNWYIKDGADKHTKEIYKGKGGQWILTTAEKKRILLNNIYGVDIDSQAVEVTKLSLLLKVLESENQETISQQLKIFHERALPDLGGNIKCGNSLIGNDYFTGELLSNPEELKRVNPFDWNSQFPDIMRNSGFDAVIGNPPYTIILSEMEREYYENTYSSFEYQINSFVLFMEKGSKLLIKSGLLSYIVPAVFLSQHYFKNIRELILKKHDLYSLLVLNYKVFEEAETGDACIFAIKNNKGRNTHHATIRHENELDKLHFQTKQQSEFCNNPRYEFSINVNDQIFKRINSVSITLGEIAVCIIGIKPYQKGKGKPKQNDQIGQNRVFDSKTCKSKDYKKYLIGKDINRYSIAPIESRYIKYGEWLAEPRNGAPFERTIILRQTSDIIRAVIDENKHYNLNNIYNIELTDKNYDYKYLLGILNSRFMVYVYQSIVPEKGRLFAEIKKVNLDKLPIRKISIDNHSEKKLHDKMVSLVERMLDLHKRLASAKNPQDKEQLQRQITATDSEIDTLTYSLYGLTKEEIKIVEEGTVK